MHKDPIRTASDSAYIFEADDSQKFHERLNAFNGTNVGARVVNIISIKEPTGNSSGKWLVVIEPIGERNIAATQPILEK